MGKIDIVILWVNTLDAAWQQSYKKYAAAENKQSEGMIRFRDYGTLPYLFRGIETNVSWVNNVHLILASDTQIPSWLNTANPKLKIHYHKEFIPVNLLPTFNSNCIELWLHRIPNLSEYYLLFNDDQFVINKLPEDMFLKDELPVFQNKRAPFRFDLDGASEFRETLDNNLKFIANYCTEHGLPYTKFSHAHLPEMHIKSFEQNIVGNNEITFLLSLAPSRFRCDKNFTNWLFGDLLQVCKKFKENPKLYKQSKYLNLNQDLQEIPKYQLVCINDTGCDFQAKIAELKTILQKIYPNKSSFEK